MKAYHSAIIESLLPGSPVGGERSLMEKFEMYVPAARGKPAGITIADLVPVGRENAISRQMLVALCVEHGLVEKNLKKSSRDRAMRRLLEQARIDYTILNLSDGKGYYKPSQDDLLDLQRYIRQGNSRAKAVFRSLSTAKALYADLEHGRMKNE